MDASHSSGAATPPGGDEHDLSALAWVLAELRRSLETANKALRRYLKEAEAAAGSDLSSVDLALLRSARSQLHQGVGALELVGLPAPASLLRAAEAAVQRLVSKPALVTPAAVATVEQASFALLDYLGRQLAGKPLSPVALFPQYRAAQQLAGADRVHPADLWPRPWTWKTLPAEPGVLPRAADAAARSAMEAQVLALMRQPEPASLLRMSDLCAGLAAGAGREAADTPEGERLATLWQLAAAVFQAQSAGLLGSDVYSKRLASRLLAQLKAGSRAAQPPSERLAQDLLFFCAHAQLPSTHAGADAAPRLSAVRQAWQLGTGHEAPADYETARLGRVDPALVALAKKRVAGAKEAWSAVAGQELHRLVGLAEQFALVGDSVQRLFPAGEDIAQALQSAAAQTVAAGDAPPPALAMEVATAVLYLDACIEDGEFDQPGLAERVQRLAQRIEQVRAGADPQPLEPWMEELYRRVSDRQTMGSVVQELRTSLSEVEKQIDQYFRNPARREVLIPVPGQLSSMRGVLSVLGMDQASQAVLHMRDDVDALAQTEVDPQRAIATGTFDRLADNLGALSFLIDMLSVQPQLAKSLFRFDPATGSLSAVMGQSERISAFADLDEASDAAAPSAAGPDDFLLDLRPPAPLPSAAAAAGVGAHAGSGAEADEQAGAQPDAERPLAEQVRALAADLAVHASADPNAEPTTDLGSDLGPEALAQRLDRLDHLAQQALAADQPELARTLGAGRRALAQAPTASALAAVQAELAQALTHLQPVASAPEPAPAPAPVPPVRAVPPGATGLEDDAEMREIFVEEAREVVDNASAALDRLAEAPETASDMTELRRAFHTLKGSSRMVGLREFGEAAWACEQLFNARLAHGARMDGALRQFTSEALAYLGDWTEAIAVGRDDGHRAPPVQQSADALRLDKPRVPITPPSTPPSTLPSAALPEAPPEAAPEPSAEPAPGLEGLSGEVAETPAEAVADAPDEHAAEPVAAEADFIPEAEADADPAPDVGVHATVTLPVVTEQVPGTEADEPWLTEAAQAPRLQPEAEPAAPGLDFSFDLESLGAPAPAAWEADAPAPLEADASAALEDLAPGPGQEAHPAQHPGGASADTAAADPQFPELLLDGDEPGTEAEAADHTEPSQLAALATLIERVPDLPSAADLDLPALPALADASPDAGREAADTLAESSADADPAARLGADDPSDPSDLSDLSDLSLDLDALDSPAPDSPDLDLPNLEQPEGWPPAEPTADLALPDLSDLQPLPELLLDGDVPPAAAPERDAAPLDLPAAEPLPAVQEAQADASQALPPPPTVAAGAAEELALDDADMARLFDSDPPPAGPEPLPSPAWAVPAEPEAVLPEAFAAPVTEAEAEVSAGGEEPMKLIGPLSISIPLFNIFLNEADEQSRRLCTDMAEWALEHEHHGVSEGSVALAHSLAGNSATVGFADLSGLARALEHALMRSQGAGYGREGEAALFVDAADEIRRLLHQFAAGFLQPVQPGLMERLAEHERLPLASEADASDSEADSSQTPLPVPDDAPSAFGAWDGDAAPPHAGSVVFDSLASGRGPAAGLSPVLVSAVLPQGAADAGTGTGARADAFDDEEGIEARDHIDTELWPIFEEEAEELLPQLQGRLRGWLEAPADPAGPAACMRTLHTLKGGARLAGAMRLGEMAHRLETAIEHLSARPLVTAADVEPLLARADTMSAWFEALGRPGAAPLAAPPEAAVEAEPEAAVDAVLDLDVDAAVAVDVDVDARTQAEAAAPADSAPAPAASALPTAQAAPLAVLPPAPEIDWSRFTLGDVAPLAAPERGGSTAAVRVRAGLLDRLVNQAGEVSITRARIDGDMRQLQGALVELTDSLDRMRRQLRDIELQAETQMTSRMEAAKAASAAFDPLEMDRFTRFQELTRFMAESVNDVATLQRGLQRTLQSTEDELAAQARLTRELQDDLLRTRMVEFESLADRLYRTVRQAAKDTGKQVRLDIVGGAIEVDRGVLERMIGPFEHLLRNSVAHGIEPAAARTAAGKDAAGKITISLAQAGNEVAVEFADDGAGLDLARIRQRALERGLLSPDHSATDAELAQLIFAAGFSTAEQVTELAGRGVGMDVVRAEVNAMGGRIETATSPGQGTRFRLLLPLTTAVTQVVTLRCGELSVAVPSTLIEIVRRQPSAEVEAAYANGFLPFGGEDVPFFWLPALLQQGSRGDTPGRSQAVVVVRSAAQRVALHVDEVTGNQEVVVKNVGPQLARLPGLAGVTLLPSGAVALIYNPVALATLYGEQARRRATGGGLPESGRPLAAQPLPAPPRAPLVLVVDDSLTVRRVTQRLLVREGYRVSTAKDGLDALEKLADERPAVLLSDIEMPRMDGFDLLRNVRADPALAGLPVVMITSRTAQKHRELAATLGANHYLGKPYGEEELLSFVAQHAGAVAPDILT